MAENNEWQPITEEELLEILDEDIAWLPDQHRPSWERYAVTPRRAEIVRSAEVGVEPVWVVAQRENRIVFYDDVEEEWAVGRLKGESVVDGLLIGELEEAVEELTK